MTYTNLMDMERYESAEWVIKNYEKYKKVIEEEVTQKRSKIEVEIQAFRTEQEVWEKKRIE